MPLIKQKCSMGAMMAKEQKCLEGAPAKNRKCCSGAGIVYLREKAMVTKSRSIHTRKKS